MRISKKILAIALSILMAVSMMPFTVFAATTGVANGSELKTAIAAAASGDVIEFTADNTTYPATSGALVIPVDGKNITIDLKGHTQYFRVSGETAVSYPTDLFVLKNGAKLTVMDSVGGGAIYTTYGSNSAAHTFNVLDTSELVIDGGEFVVDAANYGGSVIYQTSAGASTTINGGEFTANQGATGRRNTLVNTSNGEVEINGGTFTATNSFDNTVSTSTSTALVINNGEFNGAMSINGKNNEFNGGTYLTYNGEPNTAVSAYLPADKVIDANGAIADVAATTVARINSQEFTSLADAFAAVSSGSATIELVKDADVPATIAVNNGVKYTINMNGKTISSTKRVFEIRHGSVATNGTGIIETTATSAVAVYGSTESTASNYSVFNLGANTTISAPNGYGAMIGANGNASFGAVVTINGTINSKYGVYVNGNVAQTDSKNAAKFNIYGTVTADNENAVVYAAGYANWTIGTTSKPAVLTGGSGIYTKSGNVTVNNATITANGAKVAYTFNSNGANGTGDAIIIDSCGYPGSVPTVTIKGGTITSANGEAVASYAKQDDPRYTDAEFPRVDEVIPATSTAVFSSDVSALAADGYETVYDSEKGGYVVAEDTHSVAEVNGVKYDTFEAALAAISTVTTATHNKAADPTYQYKTYKANGTIKLLANTTSNGVIIGSGSDLTIDFNGKTLDINAKPVGSNGTESAAMQLLKDSDITFKDGTLTSTYTYADTDTEYIQRLIQNYANLTLDNMTVSMVGNFYDQMTMSNCNGDVTITGSTVSAPDFSELGYSTEAAAESLGARVMAVGSFNSTAYPDVNVTVTDSTINGYVNIDNTAEGATAELTLDSSDVNGKIVDESMNGATVTNTGSTVDGIPEGYEWNSNSVLAPVQDGFNLTVEDKIFMNLYVNAAAYGADTITVTYNDPDSQTPTAKTDSYDVSDLTQDAKGRYAVSILAAPAQLRDEVTVTAGSHTFTTTVAEYCETLIAQSNDAQLINLAKAMLDYGKACSDEFNYNESAFAAQNYYNTEDVTSELDLFSHFNVDNSGYYKFTGYTYIAKSVPAFRVYVNATEEDCLDGGEVIEYAYVNGVEVAPTVVEGTDRVCIDITGILAENLDTDYTISFGASEMTINPLQYAKAKGGALGRSMYNYYVAAHLYFGD